ncbi:hypothetical protein D039_2115, partial [Vibrio parahaemolyticus EKP-028]
KRKVTLPRLNA